MDKRCKIRSNGGAFEGYLYKTCHWGVEAKLSLTGPPESGIWGRYFSCLQHLL